MGRTNYDDEELLADGRPRRCRGAADGAKFLVHPRSPATIRPCIKAGCQTRDGLNWSRRLARPWHGRHAPTGPVAATRGLERIANELLHLDHRSYGCR